jgi:hypothetical protein
MRNLVDRAEYRRSQLRQGKLDAALATEFRNWARPTPKGPNANMKMLRALSPEAADRVELLAKGGGPMQEILRGLGTAAPTNVMNFSLDHIAGHLLHSVIPGGPYTIMGIGAAAKYLAGDRALKSIDEIIKVLNDAAEGEGKIAQYEQKVSPQVASHVAMSESGRRALKGWLKSGSARALAMTIAHSVKNPKLAPRIQQELENMDQENNGRDTSSTPAFNPTGQ